MPEPNPEKTRPGPESVPMNVNRWTTRQAHIWSGLPHRTVIEGALSGEIPAIVTGGPRQEEMPSAVRKHGQRKRRAGSISIPRVAFIRWYESLAARGAADRNAEKSARPIVSGDTLERA